MSSVPQPTFGPTGFIVPTEAAILVGVQTDMQAAFGGNLNPALSTPQGQIASSTTAIIGDVNNQFLFYTNQVDPAYASGRMQDGIARIYFITRNPARPTAVQALCTGLVGTVISTGALAQAADGNLYSCTAGGTIGASGNITLPFACVTTGPIPCPATSLNTIYQTVFGWDTISNPADGVLGSLVESRAEFELRRQRSVAQNSRGSLPSVLGAVLSVPALLDAYVTDNPTGSPVTLDGVTLPAHSLYVCVSGGDPQAVANAIWSKKAPGASYAGDTTVTVTDSNSGYSMPYPTYPVTFQTATAQPFIVTVTLANSTQVPSNAATLIQTAILAAFAGADGGSRARIASTVFASRYYGTVAMVGPWAQIISIKLGSSASPTANFTASISINTMTVSAVASGTLAVGQTIMGSGLPDGVRIAALGTGTGGTGTYVLNLPQTVAGEPLTATLPSLDDIVVGAAHVPTLSAANINVVLA